MRYVRPLLACAGVVLAYVLLGAFLGWKHGGGFIPMLLLGLALVVAWGAAMPED